MWFLDEGIPVGRQDIGRKRRRAGKISSRRVSAATGLPLLLLVVANCTPVAQGAGKVRLARKYRPGQSMVYITKVTTNSKIESEPATLKDFFPPVPASIRLNQQSTETVLAVQPDGTADVQHHFDKFEVQTDTQTLPATLRDSITEAQEEVTQHMVGRTLTAHYDRTGRLVDFGGADSLFAEVDAPVREPLVQMLKLFLEQMGGQSLYPDHKVKVGEEWTQKLDALPLKNYPFQVGGKNTLHYSGKTRYKGIKAAIIDYHYENALTPDLASLRKGGALPQLEAMGMHLEMKISGEGQGRILVALDDGRVLQNRSTLHQTLSAVMRKKEGFISPPAGMPRIDIHSDTELDVEGNKP